MSGLLEDYAHLIEGLLALYQTTFAPRWYEAAEELADAMISHFDADVGFLRYGGRRGIADRASTRDAGQRDAFRQRDGGDGAAHIGAIERQVALRGRSPGQSLASMQDLVRQHPLAFGQWLVALDGALATPVEVAIVGESDAEDTRALVECAQDGYHPHRLVAVGQGDVPSLLAHRTQVDGKATAYVCVNHVCQQPVTDVEEMLEQLESL